MPLPRRAGCDAAFQVVDELHLEHPHVGSRMLRDLLAAEGSKIGRRHVRTLMHRMGIEAVYRRPRTSKPAPENQIFPYLLRGLAIDRVNQVWAFDITYIPMARGFIYLAAVMDWFARRILAWRLSITLGVDFCVDAVEVALRLHGRPEILNTDQGSQFTSDASAGSTKPAPLPGVTRMPVAEALCHSMAGLITKGAPEKAHPAKWATFVLVSQGGR